ncbi:MAG: toll/interleukin-1 receptor domain-containing protein [Acidobacteriota bacterium]
MQPSELFLSHSSLDTEFATSLAELLRRHQVPVWYSRTNILGAQQWHDEIGAALERSDWLAVILSPNSVESVWVKRELLYALQQDRFENRIVPILYQPCQLSRLSWTLTLLQIVDFTCGHDAGCAALLRVWSLEYSRGE